MDEDDGQLARLVERFHLRYHIEKRELAVYAISVDRGGAKLEVSDGDADSLPSIGFRGRGELVARNANMSALRHSADVILDKIRRWKSKN